ncbi:hypothetical protein K505DRAFT_416545 [Melanomma pulvis-pyrius CBS 109.77]|uniref:GPI anchored protein n=1 Tax=Melanomma pulvis-pyrius CBS 109.77 TaxID=1314802 RepID=A0A6A6XFV0_9PLEO|nr:hypothetical protein K505DRAFT_416545 [Melanomma pulvis-pyrius CBS 109.77]
MLTQNILLAFALSTVGLAQQDIDNNDIPTQCSVVCSGLVQLTQTCDEQNNNDDNDRNYLNCVCNSTGVSAQLPLCEACVATFDNDGRDTDVNDLLTSCSFSTTTFNPSSSYASTSISAALTQITSTNTVSTTTANPTGGSSGLSSVLSSTTGTETTGSVTGQSTNAAQTMGPKVVGAGLGLGMLGAAFGMM